MVRNFDEERQERYSQLDRTFEIGGESFEIMPSIRPEVLFEITDAERSGTMKDIVGIADDTIKAALGDEGQVARWQHVRAEADPPISGRDVVDVMNWVMETLGARPTIASAPSGSPDASSGTALTDISSTPPAEASAA